MPTAVENQGRGLLPAVQDDHDSPSRQLDHGDGSVRQPGPLFGFGTQPSHSAEGLNGGGNNGLIGLL